MIKKLLYLSNFSFLALYLILAWHNRLTMDDFHFMSNVHRYGIIGGTVAEYSFFSTRWLSVFMVHSILSLMPYTNALFLTGLITLIASILSFSYLLKNIFYRFFAFQSGKLLLINLGAFTVNAFFYSCLDIGNIWFWLSAIPTYLWSFIFFLSGSGIILSRRKHKLLKLVFTALLFFYIGGSAEVFAAVILLGILAAIICLLFFKPAVIDKKVYLARLYTAFLFCLASLIVVYLGPGNAVRRGLIGEISIPKAFILNIETTGWIGLHWISRLLPAVWLFSLPLLYAGKLLSQKNTPPLKSLQDLSITLFKSVLLYSMLVFVLNYPITYLLCGIAPGRALALVSFLTWALFALAFFLIGYRTTVNERFAEKLVATTLALCLLLNTCNGIHQFIITREYAMKYDALMQELLSKKDNTSAIAVLPLPPSGMLTPLDISRDSLANNNMFIKTALGLKSNIMLIK